MERRIYIETFGILTKQEMLVSINQHTQPNTLIFENSQPYPGYYSRHDADVEKPRTIFLATKERCSLEQVVRLTFEARKVLDYEIDATPCKISIFSDTYHAIRARNFKNFTMVHDFQEYLRGEGLSFFKFKPINELASIEIQKLYNLEEIVPDIYQDLDEPGERYVTLPLKLDFGQFVRVTQAVKNNIEENNFDAALALFYRRKGLVDAVRIFEPFISVHNLEVIKKAYEEQIKRLKLREI